MNNNATIFLAFSWLFSLLLVITSVANLLLVHPVPAIAYLLLSLIYLPPANTALHKHFGFSIHFVLKIVLAIMVIVFTFGVSDLGNMIDDW